MYFVCCILYNVFCILYSVYKNSTKAKKFVNTVKLFLILTDTLYDTLSVIPKILDKYFGTITRRDNMNVNGVTGVSAFIIIGLFHPIVIKAE